MRAWAHGWSSIGFLVAVAAAGCGDSGDGSSGPTIEEVGDMLVDSYCDLFTECLPAAAGEQYFGPEGCLGRLGPTVDDGDLPEIQRSIDEGRTTYNPDQVEACLTTVDALGCAIEGTRVFQEGACADVFVGTLEEDESCLVDVDCIGDRFCDRSGGCPGTCTAPRTAGGACEDDDDCMEGLTCDGETSTCAALAGEGEACGGGVAPDCALGLGCAGGNDETMTAGTCQPNAELFAAALGATCSFETGMFCEDGLACAVTSLTGLMGPTFECVSEVATGAACKFAIPDMCPTGEHCSDIDPMAGDVDGTCAALPTAGQACIESYAGPCAPGLLCGEDMKCYAFGRIGDACSGDDTCASDHCNGGTCQAPETCTL